MNILVTLLIINSALSLDLKSEFEAFESTFSKNYPDSSERAKRFAIFAENVKNIVDHNANPAVNYRKGVNQFTDWTRDEFSTRMNGYVKAPMPEAVSVPSLKNKKIEDLPDSVDWRDKGAISEVKDQGFCGSCWAFAAIQNIESYLQIESGNAQVEELSAQQITSCCPNPFQCGGTGGCEGSIIQLGFSYAQLFGITKEQDYPYTSGTMGETGSCDYAPTAMEAFATVRGYETLERNNYKAVMNHLANVGPLGVYVDASGWDSYSNGVFDGCSYDENIEINHAVQLVGYGTDVYDRSFWIVRNSWGNRWGENGYIRLHRDPNPPCGTDSTPLIGTGCVNDGNDLVTVCGQCGILYEAVYPIGTGYAKK